MSNGAGQAFRLSGDLCELRFPIGGCCIETHIEPYTVNLLIVHVSRVCTGHNQYADTIYRQNSSKTVGPLWYFSFLTYT